MSAHHPVPEKAIARHSGILAAAGAMAIFSRFRKKKGAPPAGPAPPPPTPPAKDVDPQPAAWRAPARKGELSRPKPRRKPYTGPRLKIIVPGRRGGPGGAPPRPADPPSAAPSVPDAALCPTCGAGAPDGGGICHRCRAQAKLAETEILISSLRSKGVEVLEAERSMYQARSALALEALGDVETLCDRAEAAARRQDSDHDEASESLSLCANAIAAAMGSGKDTAGAEKVLERAGSLFRQGDYLDAMEQAALIPLLIAGRVEQGENEGVGGRGSGVGTTTEPVVPETRNPSPEPRTPTPDPLHPTPDSPAAPSRRCSSCGERLDEGGGACPRCGAGDGPAGEVAWPSECPICAEPLEPDWKSCPNCSALIDDDGPLSRCPACGRELMPKWKICPYCDTDLPKDITDASRSRPRRAAEKKVPTIPPAMRERGLLGQIEQIDRLLDSASKRGLDVTKGRNLLDLAVSFTRSRNYEKGERYVKKARNVAETMLSV